MSEKLDITDCVIIDNHAHPILKRYQDIDKIGFRQHFTESSSMLMFEKHVPTSFYYSTMLRELCEFIDIAYSDTAEDQIIEKRTQLAPLHYASNLFDDVAIGAMLVDDGFHSDTMMPIGEFAALTERPVYRILRLESVMEDCLKKSTSYEQLESTFLQEINAGRKNKAVAFKSIAAYRGGLDIPEVTAAQASDEFNQARAIFIRTGRVERTACYHYLLQQAFESAAEQNIPVQIHVGIGDADASLTGSNPSHLHELLKLKRFQRTRFVLLHCFPFVKESAFLSALFANVYFDLSLSVNLAAPLAAHLFFEALSVAPYTKLLAGTDGHSLPETHWFAARVLKRALTKALEQLIDSGYSTHEEALSAAAHICHANARELYRLDGLS